MNIVIIKDKLKEGLDIVSRASGDHPTLPILKNIMIEAKDGVISLTATNLEIGIRHKVSGKIIQDGKTTVPASVLSQMISNLSEDRIEMLVDGSILSVKTPNYNAEIQGSSTEEFPLLPEIESKKEFIEIESELLKSSLDSILSASQFSELRPDLSSVYFQFLGDSLVLVCTDSFRLAEKTINDSQFKANIEGEFKVLVPLKTAQELSRSIAGAGSVKIYRDSNQILFSTESMDLISRLLDGSFPDYMSIVPEDYKLELVLTREEILGAIKLSGVMSGASTEISLRPDEGGRLEIFSRDEKLGENSYKIAAEMDKDFKETSFNWKYLLDGIKSISSKEIFLGLNDDNKPAVIRAKQDSSYFYILMPILKN